MKSIAERLAGREASWKELERLLDRWERRGIARRPVARVEDPPIAAPFTSEAPSEATATRRRVPLTARELIRLSELYRAACADLMLAESHDLPSDTVDALHALVARAHNALYRSQGFRFRAWAIELFDTVPRRLRRDPTLRISLAVFYGSLLVSGLLAAFQADFAENVLGLDQIAVMETMYAEPVSETPERDDSAMTGFYIHNNAGIGLTCFGLGLSFGLGTIFLLLFNGVILGAVFGHMATTTYAANFYEFVTSHGPFELTAIAVSGAAGLRVGWGAIQAVGQRRVEPLRQEAADALPIAGASVVLFVLAAFLEGFVSASALPYAAKAAIALMSAALLIAYVVIGGRRRGGAPASSINAFEAPPRREAPRVEPRRSVPEPALSD